MRRNFLRRGASLPLLLDLYPNAATAYSLRKLRTGQVNAIRVRESSGNTEADIGFDVNGDLDTTALLAHCGANDGFVTTWYDQSGNGSDATQTSSSVQSQIVSSGSVILENGKAAVQSVSSDSYTIDRISYSNLSIFSVSKNTTTNQNSNTILSQLSGFIQKSNQIPTKYPRFQVHDGSFKTAEYQVDVTGTQVLQVGITDNGTARIFINNDAGLTAAYGTLSNPLGDFKLLSYPTIINTSHIGTVQEVILWDDNQISNRTEIESNINSYYSIY